MFSNKLAISTISLGQHPSHALDHKIKAAAQAGFAGVEVVFSDLETFSQSQSLSLAEGPKRIKEICDAARVEILALAPFENYEGDNSPLRDRLQKAARWIEIARILRAPYLQVPSQFKTNVIGNEDVITSELQQLADLGSSKQPLVSIAYEPLSWGTYHNTWEDSLQLVQAVNRPNFGLCLDTFHIITKLWANPFSTSGKFPDADRKLRQTLDLLVQQCPLEKIFYVQLSDGEKFDPPFSESHPWYLDSEAPQFTWSKHARPFPLETHMGGYMPVSECVKAWIIEKGFTGWVSLETFDRRMRERDSRPEEAAARGIRSWRNVQSELGSASNL